VIEDGTMPRPAACLFDLDGLLLDTEPLHAQAWQAAASHFGRRLNRAELLSLRGRRRQDCVRQGVDLAWRDQCQPSHGSGAAGGAPAPGRGPAGVSPTDAGAEALVNRCAERGIPMALATSSSRDAVALKTAPHPWLAPIAERVYGDDPSLGAGKPAPDVYLLAAERLGVRCDGCWAFEDSPAGAQAATAAGCRVYVVAPPELDPSQHQDHYPASAEIITTLDNVPPF
jgi:beta-phosphoglucomutase-like phosphatase (HAD superfamily)